MNREPGTFAVYIAYSLQAVGMAISWQFVTYFLKHELEVTSFVWMTVIFATSSIVMAGAVNLWGAVSDRLRQRKPFMILGFLGYLFTYLLYSFVTSSVEYFLITIVGSFFSAAALPVGQAFLTTETEKKGERLGLLLVAQSAGWFCGAFSSGVLYDVIGMFMLYRIAAVLSGIAAVFCILFVRDIPVPISTGSPESSIFEVLSRPGMARLVFAAAFSALGINAVASVTAIIIADELGGLTAYVGIANSTATAIAAMITGYVGRVIDRKGPIGVLILGYVAYVLFSLGFALVRDPILATVLFAIPIYPLSSTAALSFGALISDEQERGRAMGLVNGAQNVGAAVGPIAGGVFADYVFFRAQPIAWLCFAFNLIALVLAVSLVKADTRTTVVLNSDNASHDTKISFSP